MRGIDIIGKKFGSLVVEYQHEQKINKGELLWVCKCVCGKIVNVSGSTLRSKRKTHCGCLKKDSKGGQSKRPEYTSWKSMIYRCTKPDKSHFYLYGGRGITVCPQWLDDFWQFFKDVGPKPTKNHSLDRKDVNGNYDPTNVRWATPIEQSANRRPQPKRINFNDYQNKAGMTALYPNKGEFGGLIYCLFGVFGEAGELMNHAQKALRDNGGEFNAEIKKKMIGEMGDMLWFMSQLCKELEIDFSHVPIKNLDKLADRMERGKIGGSGDNR